MSRIINKLIRETGHGLSFTDTDCAAIEQHLRYDIIATGHGGNLDNLTADEMQKGVYEAIQLWLHLKDPHNNIEPAPEYPDAGDLMSGERAQSIAQAHNASTVSNVEYVVTRDGEHSEDCFIAIVCRVSGMKLGEYQLDAEDEDRALRMVTVNQFCQLIDGASRQELEELEQMLKSKWTDLKINAEYRAVCNEVGQVIRHQIQQF